MEKEIHTIDFIKRKAKKLKKDLGITHTQALEQIAKELGYSNWKHCQRSLSKQTAVNIIPVKEQIQLSFNDWLNRHKHRNSPLGDLATDMLNDSAWPLYNTLEEYQYYLYSKRTHSNVLRTLKETWKTYTAYLKRQNLPKQEKIQLGNNFVKKDMPRKIVYVKNVQPLHYADRKRETFTVGDKAWISWNGRKAIPVIVTEVDGRNYSVKTERPLKKVGNIHSLFLDEVRSTPELACINCVTF